MILRAHARCGITAIALLVTPAARADYISSMVPLNSQGFNETVGKVVAEANNGTTTTNGLAAGSVRLTFSISPIPAYTQNGTGVGFTRLIFNSDLSIAPSEIVTPAGWSILPPAAPQGVSATNPGAPPSFSPWQITSSNNSSGNGSVAITIAGLGKSATLDHFLTPVQYLQPNSVSAPLIFQGEVVYPGAAGQAMQDSFSGNSVTSTPEPSTLAMAAAGLAALVIARRRRLWGNVQG